MNDSMTKDRVRVPTPQNGNGDVVDDDDDDDHHHHPNRPPQHHQKPPAPPGAALPNTTRTVLSPESVFLSQMSQPVQPDEVDSPVQPGEVEPHVQPEMESDSESSGSDTTPSYTFSDWILSGMSDDAFTLWAFRIAELKLRCVRAAFLFSWMDAVFIYEYYSS